MSDFPASRVCSVCGTPLIGDEPGGLCPKCLLLAGLAADSRSQLHIRCPQCQAAIQIVDDPSVRDVTCPSCDSRFSLIGDCAATVVSEQGAMIGRFELIERVGIGAFGSVWKARDPELDRQVAIKLPRKEHLSDAESEQFLREARAAGQLTHPGIVSVHEVGRDDNRIYIVSDFIPGVTLADSLSAQRPTIREAIELCGRVAEALRHAHEQGVVHRDLKPSNIMLDDVGLPHVMDFGLAKREAAEITMTVEGRILGTPAYMSPEQASGDAHRADARSDIYSLGVILYELLTGEKPFRGTSQMLLHQVLKEDPPSPRKLNGSLPKELETICLKCLAKEPEKRFASAQDLADELRRFLAGEPIRSRPISTLERGWRWCRRNRIFVGLTASVALSLLIGLATTFWQWRIAQDNFEDATEARGVVEQSQLETQAALNESESRLAHVYVERGLQNVDVDPHVGLPWLLQALNTEPEDSPGRQMNRLRIGLMLHELPALLGFWPNATDARFNGDGSQVAIAVGNEAHVFRLPDMNPIPVMQHSQPVVSVAFATQGDRLATVSVEEGRPPLCRIWNTSTGLPETESLDLTETKYKVNVTPTIHFTPDGDRFVAVYAGLFNRWHSKMATRVFDSRTMQQIGQTFAHHSDLDYTTGYHELSPDATRVLIPRGTHADDSRVPWSEDDFPDDTDLPQQYDLITAQLVHPPLDHQLEYYGKPKYSDDGSMIATSDHGLLKVWDAGDGTLIKEFPLSPDVRYARVRFHPDGTSLFIVERRKTLWRDIQSGDLKREWKHEDIFLVDPTARIAVYRDSNGSDYLSEIQPSGVRVDEHSLPELYNVSFCPDGSRFMLKPSGHNEAGMRVSPPQQIFRTSDAAALAPPWRFRVRSLGEPFSRTGRHYLCKLDEGIWLWDLDQRRKIVETFPPQREGQVIDAAVSRDRATLVVLTDDLAVTCWDAETGRQLFEPFHINAPSETDSGSDWKYLTVNDSGNKVALVGEYSDPTPENDIRDVPVVQAWDLKTGQLLFDTLVFDAEASSWVDPVRFIDQGESLVITESVNRWRLRQQGGKDAHDSTRLHFIDTATGNKNREPIEFDHQLTLLELTADGTQCLVLREGDSWTAGVPPPRSQRTCRC